MTFLKRGSDLMHAYIKKNGKFVPTTRSFQTQPFPGHYAIGYIDKGYPDVYGDYKKIKTARAAAYVDVKNLKESMYVFIQCGYYSSDKKKVVTHYAPIGRVFILSETMVWEGQKTKQKNELKKDGLLGRRL